MTTPEQKEPGQALAPRVEIGHLTAEHIRTIDEVAVAWKANWTSLEKAKPDDLKTIARLIIQAYPSFSSFEMMSYFYILGGKLYENAEFWMHQAASHPDFRGSELAQIFPGTPDWDELIGKKQDPDVILAAVKCTARRKQPGGEHRVEVEASYVLATDSILSEYAYHNLGSKVRVEAELEARQLGAVDKLFWQLDNPNAPRGAPGAGAGKWVARVATPKPDAQALALKKARTTATRRCLRRVFSLGETRITATLAQANHYLGTATGHVDEREDEWLPMYQDGKLVGRFRAGGSVARVPLTEARYGEDDARQAPREIPAGETGSAIPRPSAAADDAVGAGAAARFRQEQGLKAESGVDTAADRAGKLISEQDRRKLYTALEGRDFTKYADDMHEALRALIGEMKHVLPADPRASTKDLTYPEWEQLRILIDALPFAESDGGTT